MNYRQLQEEVGKRFAELRRTHAHGISPEDLAERAKAKGLKLNARTIRQIEAATGNPSLDTLHHLLTFYGITLGDFFRFTLAPTSDEAALLDSFMLAIKRPAVRKSLKTLLEVLRETP